MVEVLENHSLKGHNTFAVEATARYFARFASEADLAAWLPGAGRYGPLLPIGEGSNLLFTAPWEGCVLSCTATGHRLLHQDEREVLIQVQAGASWDALARHCASQGWYGTQNLAAIPGTVGAAAVQNIGAYGAEAAEIIHEVRALDLQGRLHRFGAGDCGYGYRQSRFKQEKDLLVTAVTFRLQKAGRPDLRYGDLARRVEAKTQAPAQVQAQAQAQAPAQVQGPTPTPGVDPLPLRIYQTVCEIRAEKLPSVQTLPNAGSFFMNPVVEDRQAAHLSILYPDLPQYPTADPRKVKLSAAWLIQEAGWKGRSLGPAGVSAQHALILVNRGGATGAQIRDLALAIRQDVFLRFGVSLVPEVQIL